MFCSKCGNEMPDGSAFCSKCGTAFNENAVSVNTSFGASPARARNAAMMTDEGINAIGVARGAYDTDRGVIQFKRSAKRRNRGS